MSLLSLLLTLLVVGVLLWAVTTYVPMAPQFKRLITAVAVIATVIWLLQVFGLLDSINSIHVGRVHR